MTEPDRPRLLPVRPDGFQQHPLHAADQVWSETNCALDLWIEVLHALGLDPVAAGACALSAGMRGEQWLFLKYPLEDLRRLYGLQVDEFAVWRPTLDHTVEQARYGRPVTIEVDSWFLPDTGAISYRQRHVKSTILPNVVDPGERYLEYFHNSGYFTLSGDDFDGVFRQGAYGASAGLVPYVEVVGLDMVDRDADLLPVVTALAREHLAHRPATNPIDAFAARVLADLPWLAAQDLDTFHDYAFAVVRQCGVSAQIASHTLTWLGERGEDGLGEAAAAFYELACGAKTLQFQLARVIRGRSVDLDATLNGMASMWDVAMAGTLAWAG